MHNLLIRIYLKRFLNRCGRAMRNSLVVFIACPVAHRIKMLGSHFTVLAIFIWVDQGKRKKSAVAKESEEEEKSTASTRIYTVSTLNFSTFNKCYREFHQHKIAIIINHFSYTAARLSSSLSGFAWFCRQPPNFVLFLSWH